MNLSTDLGNRPAWFGADWHYSLPSDSSAPLGLWLRFRLAAHGWYDTGELEDLTITWRGHGVPAECQFQAGEVVQVLHISPWDRPVGLGLTTIRLSNGGIWGKEAGAVEATCTPATVDAALAFVWGRPADEAAFWAAMLAAPTDALPRRVYADWLDERGDPAAPYLRGDRPFLMNLLVSEGGAWEQQSRQSAEWLAVAAQVRAFAAQPDMVVPETVRDFDRLRLTRSVRPRTSYPKRAEWDRHRLEVTLDSGEPPPAFVNYMLFRSAGSATDRGH
jgi:uncharacterized protein (TIGR02996 family)